MISAAFLLLPALASAEYLMAIHESCKKTCEDYDMECNKKDLAAVDSAEKLAAIYDEFGMQSCDQYEESPMGPSWLEASEEDAIFCHYMAPGVEPDCEYNASPAIGLCACAPPSCVNPEEEHELEADADGIIAELNQCHFDVEYDCDCMELCQQDDYHLSFEWKEGESPNCCCYVEV